MEQDAVPHLRALWKGIKGMLRTFLMAGLAFLLSDGVVKFILTRFFHTYLDTQGLLIMTAAFTNVLSFTDRYLHELGNETGNTFLEGGITRF